MISMIALDGKEKENKSLELVVKNLAAMLTDEKWDMNFFVNSQEFENFISSHPLVDLSCVDITLSGSIDLLQKFRKHYEEAALMLIADATVSPLLYLKPGIRPDSLLMRPLSKDIVNSTMKEFIFSYVESITKKDGVKTFVIDTKEGKINIPYSDIYYFEAREKKLFIRTLTEEYGFYGTIDNIQETLTESFARCHRSFILNTSKIKKIMLSQNLIELADGFEVPLSRSFKPYFKKYGK